MAEEAVVTTASFTSLPKIASGKVRDLYEVDSQTLLFVATDRVSAYDIIMSNGVPSKGPLLTQLSSFWFHLLPTLIPGLRTHFLTLDLPPQVPSSQRALLKRRAMQVRRFKVFPIEAIVRGYITGSAWAEYQHSQTVHGIPQPAGLRASEAFPGGPIYTPSTKAEAGQNDQNIHPSEASRIVGETYAARIEELALKLYTVARDFAKERGIIIADTKFEFGVDEEGEVVLVDEVLTPDSSRFWRMDKYEVGREQESFDKQYLRNWLTREGLKGKDGVRMPDDVVRETARKYREAYEGLTGEKWEDLLVEKEG